MKKLEVGNTLSEVFGTYRDHAGVLLPVAFWLFLVVAVINGVAENSLALFPVAIVAGTVAATLYEGMVAGLVRDAQAGRGGSSVGELMKSVLPVLWPLIAAGLLAGIGIAIGTILLVVPGLILMTIWAVIAPVIVVERSGVFAAFGRSQELVRDNGWPVFGVIVVAALIAGVASFAFIAIAAGIADGPILRIVFAALASTLTAPIEGLVAAVLYFRLLAIKGAPAAPGPAEPAPPAPPAS